MDVASPVPANLMDDNGNTNDVTFPVEETKCGTGDRKMEPAMGGNGENTQDIKQAAVGAEMTIKPRNKYGHDPFLEVLKRDSRRKY